MPYRTASFNVIVRIKTKTSLILFLLGKKKIDPNFVGDEKTILRSDEEPVIFEVCEAADDVKEEDEEEGQEEAAVVIATEEDVSDDVNLENDDEDVDWEAFNAVRTN